MHVLASLSAVAFLAALAPAFAVEALLVASGTAEDTPAEGLYTVACLPSATCDGTIRRTGPDRFAFEWVAMDRTGQEVFCRYTADLTLGTTDEANSEDPTFDVRWTNVLVGTLSGTGQKVMALAMPGGRLFLFTEGDVCLDVNRPDGVFAMNGFYDRLIGDE